MKRLTVPVVCLVAGWMAVPAEAGSLSGRVWDPTGGVVPKASVAVLNVGSGARQSATTGETGDFSFQGLPAGRYEVEVSAPGFQQYRRRGVSVAADGEARLAVVLRLGEVMETLVVQSQGTPRPPAGPTRVRVGGHVQAPKLIRQVRPAYPQGPKDAGLQGSVVLRATILKDGGIGELTVMSGVDPLLAAEAENAVRQWRYQPALLNGQPVEVVTTIKVDFRLQP